MPKVRVAGFGISLDGFSAGTEQSLDNPLGKRGTELFQWFFLTRSFRTMHGQEGGSVGVDDGFAYRAMDNFGAFILGRNMFESRCVGRGRMTRGGDGGGPIRRTTLRPSF